MQNIVRPSFLAVVALLSASLNPSLVFGGPEPKVVVPLERSFYLTVDAYQGDSAKTACAVGYHFASISELAGWKNMVYNTVLGLTVDDREGAVGGTGWARVVVLNDWDNCYDWTSNLHDENGLAVVGETAGLSMYRFASDPSSSPWDFSGHQTCNLKLKVWCVSDPNY